MNENEAYSTVLDKIVNPLVQLNSAAMEIANGNLDVTIDVHTDDEVCELFLRKCNRCLNI